MFCLILCSIGPTIAEDIEIGIFFLNAEWFFDDKFEPNDENGKGKPTPEQYKKEAEDIATLINEHNVNIVGLAEVENQEVVEKVKSNLNNPEDWKITFRSGRDNSTGQDVALLTKLPIEINEESKTTFPDERQIFVENGREYDVNPSRILGVELKIDNQPFYILITHLISRLRNDDEKRLAQATVVRRQAVKAMRAGKHVIVMGDMNDTPGTPVLRRLRGFDDIWGTFLQTANAVETDDRYTHIYKGKKFLLDHILISPSLWNEFRNVEKGKRCEIIDVGELSDHHAILAWLRISQP